MTLRHLVTHNFRWKLFSVVLAAIFWLYIHASLRDEGRAIIRENPVSGLATAEFLNRFPVKVLTASQDANIYRVDPAEAEVTVRGESAVLQDLNWQEIKIFVDLTDLATNSKVRSTNLLREIQVHAPPNITAVKVDPPAVVVRRIAPAPAQAATKSIQPTP
ncbi:MAG TPA: CdaR family protein [Verrucomicrobiae bacterium]|jgi:YbbR domain-containing protein